MGLHIISYNVNGIKDSSKRKKVFALAKANNVDILLLQETHCCNIKDREQFDADWGSKGIYSFSYSSHECGVAIYFNSNISYEISKYYNDTTGRLVLVNFKFGNDNYCIVNTYAPNIPKARKDFFNSLDRHLMGIKKIIFAGDFNCVENVSLDKIGGNDSYGTQGAEILKNICNSFLLSDAFRHLYPKKKEYSYVSKSNNVKSRLDRFYVSNDLLPFIESCIITPNPYSDHAMVSLHFKDFDSNSFTYGPGFWRCNVNVLDHPDFVTDLTDMWNILVKVPNQDAEWWEICKQSFKKLIIAHSRELASQFHKQIKHIESELRYYSIRHFDDPGAGYDRIVNALNVDLSNLIDKHLAGSRIRSKVKHLQSDDTPCRFFLRKEIKKGSKKMLKCLNHNGIKVKNQQDITNTCRQFYANLFTAENVNIESQNDFLKDVPVLSDDDKKKCEGLLTYSECFNALKCMKNDKCPGSDGLPKEFYVKFFPLFGQAFVKLLNNLFYSGVLTESQRYGIISLLFKNVGLPEFLTNWRPISLLNVDYKIISKCMCLRLRKVIGKLVSIDQTCSVPGRSILDNGHLLRCIVDYVDQKDMPLAIINLDQTKAFDRVSHDFMFNALKAYGFGPDFLSWVELLYNDVSSSILVNGYISNPFPITRSVRQGCSLSPLLYALCIEPLAIRIRACNNICGLHLPGSTDTVKIIQFADDNSILCTDYMSIYNVFSVMDNFCHASGAMLNLGKCVGLWLGKWRNNTDNLCNISWTNDATRIVGFLFRSNNYVNSNWDPVLDKFKSVLSDWKHRNLSFKGKAIIVNTLALGKIFYVGSVILMPKEYFECFEKLIFNFIWGNMPEAVSRNTMYNKCLNGGIGLVNVQVKLKALLVMHLIKFINGTDAKWQFFTRYWLGLYLRKYNPACDSNMGPHASPLYIPKFYKVALDALTLFLSAKPNINLKKVTTKMVYDTLLKQEVPKIVSKFPFLDFGMLWKNLNSSFIESCHRDTSFRVLHNVLPIGQHLYYHGISKIIKCYFCTGREMFPHLFHSCPKVHPVIQYFENLMGQMLGHTYRITPAAMVFLNIVPTGYKHIDQVVLYVICLIKHSIWLQRNLVKFENKVFDTRNVLNIIKSQIRLRIFADYARLKHDEFDLYWLKNDTFCSVIDDKLIVHV